MAVSLAGSPFAFTLPARFGLRLSRGRRAVAAVRHARSVPTACAAGTSPALPQSDTADWTAEEQDFLRALREAGL